METAGLFVIIVIIGALEAPRLIKEKMWKELGVFSLLLLTGATLAIVMVMDITFLNPVKVLEKIFTPVGKWIEQVLT